MTRDVARVFEKEHKHVLRDIGLLACSSEFSRSNFGLSNYTSDRGKEYPEYLMTRDGFTLLHGSILSLYAGPDLDY